MLQFQRLMNRFLETQQQVMLSYLGGATNTVSQPTEISAVAPVPEPASAPTSPSQRVPSEVSSSVLLHQRRLYAADYTAC